MFFYEGYICPVCKQKFQETDDIVACPDCGAPHHRECWRQEGHCHFAADHGTPRQWKRPADNAGAPVYHADASQPTPGSAAYNSAGPGPSASGGPRYCPHCGQQNPEYAEFCSRCGQSLTPSEWTSGPQAPQQNSAPYNNTYGPFPGNFGNYSEYSPFHMPFMDPYGGVAHDEKIRDVSAEDLVTFIGPNSAYYLPRAVRMERSGSHASWNWAAFLFTPYWLLYRKNYLWGCIALAFDVIQTFLSSFIMGMYIEPSLDMTSDASMMQSLRQVIEGGKLNIYFYIIALLFFSDLLVRIIFGMVSNSLYLHTAVSRIKKIREKNSEGIQFGQNVYDQVAYHHDLVTNGGISLILVAVAAGIAWFGQILVQTLFMYKL